MSWFRVDDKLHGHRKARLLRKSHPSKHRDSSPFGIWVLAGSYASDNRTDGFVPTEILSEWDDYAILLARRLVDAGFWWATEQDGEEGFGFHDWRDYLPRPEGIEDASESGRRGNHVRWHESLGKASPECEFCQEASPRVAPISGDDRPDSRGDREPVPIPDPTRPDPKPPARKLADPEGFAAFWENYPRKVGRAAAVKAYRSALKVAPPDAIAAGLRRALPAMLAAEEQFRPHPTTWLNQERWADGGSVQAIALRPSLPYAHEIELAPDGMTPEQSAAWDEAQRARWQR